VDSSLVFNENFSEIRLSSGWDQVRHQQPKTYLSYDVTHKKNNPKPNSFLIADVKTCRIFCEFEQLSCTIIARDIPMQKHVETAGF